MIEERDEDLLAGLDAVDWAGLHHAYGSAEDVPGLLRKVCGDDEESRASALMSLFSNIFHQGTRYSASPYAVPFLARIAVAGPRPARTDTLILLKCLAVDWHDEYDLPQGIDTLAWRAAAAEFTPEGCVAWYDECLAVEQDPEKRRDLEEHRAYCAAGGTFDSRASALISYDAVRAELVRLSCLLDDPNPEVRTRIAYLLAWFPEEGAWTVPLLLARLESESDGRAAATDLVAVGLVGDRTLVPALRLWLGHEDPLLRWAAATALARVTAAGQGPDPGDDGLVERVIGELARAAAAPAPAPRPDFNQGNLHGYTARTLLTLVDRAPDTVLAAIVDAFGGMTDRQIGGLARIALPAAFPRSVDQALTPFNALGSGQQRVLRAFGENGPWRHYGEWFESALRELGLPDTQQSLCAYAQTESVGRMPNPDDPFDT